MTGRIRRAAAMLLCLVMVLQMAPVTALASGIGWPSAGGGEPGSYDIGYSADKDFSSRRLLAAFSEGIPEEAPGEAVAVYGDTYLLEFGSEEEAEAAYLDYLGYALFV